MEKKKEIVSLMETKHTKTCRGQPLELRYALVCTCMPDGAQTYGVQIQACRAGVKTCARVEDVTRGQQRAQQLLSLLARGTVTPETLSDVVLDWLE